MEKEREFKVLVYALSGKPKRMFSKGDIVRESQLNRSADSLIRGGYIELVETSKAQPVAEPKKPAEKESDPEGEILFTVEVNGKKIEVREEGDINKKEIAIALDNLGIDFDTTKNKATLFALLLGHFKG